MSAFIEFLAKNNALSFGEFSLSGRTTPYFIDPSALTDGAAAMRLGEFFAAKINEKYGPNFNAVYGPAYRGIPLAVSTSIALSRNYNINRKWIFDIKERKITGHSAERSFYGADKLDTNSKVIIVDYVFSMGRSKTEMARRLSEGLKARVAGVVVGVDRLERAAKRHAVEEFMSATDVPVHPIVNIREIFDYLRSSEIEEGYRISEKAYSDCISYLKKYGV